eukprot:12421138-Alexandrium_andersonii.AAC.1
MPKWPAEQHTEVARGLLALRPGEQATAARTEDILKGLRSVKPVALSLRQAPQWRGTTAKVQ